MQHPSQVLRYSLNLPNYLGIIHNLLFRLSGCIGNRTKLVCNPCQPLRMLASTEIRCTQARTFVRRPCFLLHRQVRFYRSLDLRVMVFSTIMDLSGLPDPMQIRIGRRIGSGDRLRDTGQQPFDSDLSDPPASPHVHPLLLFPFLKQGVPQTTTV